MSEWLTDKEKRILFSALTREKSVCIQVDKQCEPREPYEQSLQSVCESLEHKFYHDRLFKQMEKQIRAEAIDDFANGISEYLGVENATKYGNKNAEQQSISYDTLMKYEIADAIDDIAEQLKAGGENEYNI